MGRISVKYSVCIDMMFSDYDFYDRFKMAKKSGADAVEFWRWSIKDLEKVSEELENNGLSFAIFNMDSEDETLSAELLRGILNQGRKEDVKKALIESIPVYKRLGAAGMIVLIGETLDIPYDEQIENIKECLRYVAPIAEKEGITLLLEPLNDFDRKNYFLPRAAEVFEIIREIGSPNIKLLFDIYHEQLMRGNLINSINENIDSIGHFHVADAPGRHEPGTGEINYPNVLKAIENTAYDRYVGLEYRATIPDEKTFGFINKES